MELKQLPLNNIEEDSVIIVKLYTGAELIGKVEKVKEDRAWIGGANGVTKTVLLRKVREVHAVPQRNAGGVTMQLSIDKPYVVLDPEGLVPFDSQIQAIYYECPSELEKGYITTTSGIAL